MDIAAFLVNGAIGAGLWFLIFRLLLRSADRRARRLAERAARFERRKTSAGLPGYLR